VLIRVIHQLANLLIFSLLITGIALRGTYKPKAHMYVHVCMCACSGKCAPPHFIVTEIEDVVVSQAEPVLLSSLRTNIST
jgi:hypothetical protein